MARALWRGPVSGRKSPRFKIDTPGMIYNLEGAPLFACTVRDISASGAGLALSEDAPLPESFFLAFTRNGALRRLCAPVWQLSVVAGVRFTDGS